MAGNPGVTICRKSERGATQMPDEPDKPVTQSGTQLVERKLSTIVSADVAEFSRLMGEDEEQTLRTFRGHKKVFEALVATHRGRIFNTAGDAILAEFSSAVEAVRCATDIQSALRTRNDKLPLSRQVRFRIGINLGDVMIQGQDLLGDGVNVAARLQTAAEPGGICISGSVHDQIRNKLSLSFQSLGERNFKNIQQPVRTFSIVDTEGGGVLPSAKPRSPWRSAAVWIVAALVILAGVGYAAYAFHQRSKSENPPATAANVQPEPAPSQAVVPESAKPAMATPPAPQPQPKADLPAGDLKTATKSGEATGARATSTHRGPYDGVYSGRICYARIPNFPEHCYQAEGVVRGTKISGKWPMPNESGVTMFMEGEVTPSGEVTMAMHSDRTDGTRVAAINLTGEIRDGSLKATGKFLKGRPANLNWHLNSEAAR
jgi:class 3 adenylate cyclase